MALYSLWVIQCQYSAIHSQHVYSEIMLSSPFNHTIFITIGVLFDNIFCFIIPQITNNITHHPSQIK